MPQDNELSPLFGHMQDTPAPDVTPAPSEDSHVVSDKTNSVLEGFSTTPEPVAPPAESAFGTPVSAPVTPPHPVSSISPGLTELLPSSPQTPEISPQSLTQTDKTNSLLEGFSTAPEPVPPLVELPELPSVPVIGELPLTSDVSKDIGASPEPVPPPVDAPSPENPLLEDEDRDIPLRIIHTESTVPTETPEETTSSLSNVEKGEEIDNLRLTQYLQADKVYQEMIRVESQEKIRLQLAIRYTLLMFAIFLVFAWIVSNRIIMFGFSEFVWLARIRDLLFAVMAGLFGMTLWFGSVSWTQNRTLVTIIRTLAIAFSGLVIIALYIPF